MLSGRKKAYWPVLGSIVQLLRLAWPMLRLLLVEVSFLRMGWNIFGEGEWFWEIFWKELLVFDLLDLINLYFFLIFFVRFGMDSWVFGVAFDWFLV